MIRRLATRAVRALGAAATLAAVLAATGGAAMAQNVDLVVTLVAGQPA